MFARIHHQEARAIRRSARVADRRADWVSLLIRILPAGGAAGRRTDARSRSAKRAPAYLLCNAAMLLLPLLLLLAERVATSGRAIDGATRADAGAAAA